MVSQAESQVSEVYQNWFNHCQDTLLPDKFTIHAPFTQESEAFQADMLATRVRKGLLGLINEEEFLFIHYRESLKDMSQERLSTLHQGGRFYADSLYGFAENLFLNTVNVMTVLVSPDDPSEDLISYVQESTYPSMAGKAHSLFLINAKKLVINCQGDGMVKGKPTPVSHAYLLVHNLFHQWTLKKMPPRQKK